MSALTTPAGWRQNDPRKTATAIGASVIFHLLLILFITFFVALHQPPPPAPVGETPVELTFVDAPVPKPKNAPEYVETSASQRAEKPPENAPFESDKDTQAASPLPASGDAPVPTLDGEISPALSLENRDYTPGREALPSAPPAPAPTQSAPPEPSAEAQPTPRTSSGIALLELPKPKPESAKPAPKAIARPAPPSAPGYQPQTRVTRIRGNISNRGRASVAANATPIGRYKKMLSDAIGSRWYYYVNDRVGLLEIGTLEVRFIVREDGKVEQLRVVSNSSNESFASCSLEAIMEAEIPPIPKEIVPLLVNGRIEIEYSFTILSN